jgi:hypothetical protein
MKWEILVKIMVMVQAIPGVLSPIEPDLENEIIIRRDNKDA